MPLSPFGILIAPDNKEADRNNEMRLSSDKNMFKYVKTVLLKTTMPSGANASISVVFAHGLTFVPAFSTYMKGSNGRWGRISKGVQAVGYGNWNYFPFAGTERVDRTNYYADISSVQSMPGDILIRVTFLFNEMQI